MPSAIMLDSQHESPQTICATKPLAALIPYFNREKWYSGADFPTEDSMHFEVSKELLGMWLEDRPVYQVTGNSLSNNIVGSDASDRIYAYGGNDTVLGNRGSDRILGQSGNDTLKGGGGRDRLVGGAGKDFLIGGNSDDRLYGGSGNDKLKGGTGSDIFVFKDGWKKDTIIDFGDNQDTLAVDNAIWGGGLTVAQVISTYASTVNGHVEFNFENGDVVRLLGISDPNALLDDVLIF